MGGNIVLQRKEKRRSSVHRFSSKTSSCFSSSGIGAATSVRQAGLEKHQSSVRPLKPFRVLPDSLQRAKLQGSADSNFSGEGTRGFR
jgi:hypothetical protein